AAASRPVARNAGGDAALGDSAAVDLLSEADERGVRAFRRQRLRGEIGRDVAHVLFAQRVGERLHGPVDARLLFERAQLPHDVARVLTGEARAELRRWAVAVRPMTGHALGRLLLAGLDGTLLGLRGRAGREPRAGQNR